MMAGHCLLIQYNIGWREFVGLLGLLFVLVSCPADAATDGPGNPEKTDMVVAYPQPSGASTPLWVAYETGQFKKYGLNPTLHVLNPQAAVQAVVSGSADFAGVGVDLLNARLQGARLRVLVRTLERFVFQTWGAREITNVQQLKGKIVAVSTPRSLIEIATREALKKIGLTADKDVKFLPARTVDGILTAVLAGQAAAGTLSAPTTLKARDGGLNLLMDIGQMNIPGLHAAYGATEKYIKENPNTIYAFLQALAEGLVLTTRDPATAKKAIAKYTRIDDPRMVDEAYEAFTQYWAPSPAVRAEVVQAWFGYLDEKEFPQAKTADPKEFYDNSFVDNLKKWGFFQKIGWGG